MKHTTEKYILFDLDETLGHFAQIAILYEVLKEYFNVPMDKTDFFLLLSAYPEVFRPSIFNVFEYIAQKKKEMPNLRIGLFTNNQCKDPWAHYIMEYIHSEIKAPLFDIYIGAFMKGNEIYETQRTGHEKSFEDFKRITKCGAFAPILFFDDQMHHAMIRNDIQYCNITPYRYTYPYEKMVYTFLYTFNQVNKQMKKEHHDMNSPEIKMIQERIVRILRRFNYSINKEYVSQDDHMYTEDMMQTVKKFLKPPQKYSSNKITPRGKRVPHRSKTRKRRP